jgi:hypothetical protein
MREAFRTGGSGLLLIAIMLGGGVVLWVGVPLGWLWVGGQVQGATGSLGAAVAAMMAGVVVSIGLIMPVLAWLNQQHGRLRERRGLESHGQVLLEGVMTVSAGLALVVFSTWFFLFSGSSPLPTGLGF